MKTKLCQTFKEMLQQNKWNTFFSYHDIESYMRLSEGRKVYHKAFCSRKLLHLRHTTRKLWLSIYRHFASPLWVLFPIAIQQQVPSPQFVSNFARETANNKCSVNNEKLFSISVVDGVFHACLVQCLWMFYCDLASEFSFTENSFATYKLRIAMRRYMTYFVWFTWGVCVCVCG